MIIIMKMSAVLQYSKLTDEKFSNYTTMEMQLNFIWFIYLKYGFYIILYLLFIWFMCSIMFYII